MKKAGVLLFLTGVLIACLSGCGGTKYICSSCGAEVREAYYDPFDTDTYLCAECAKEYFAPLPYTSYRVQ